MDDLKIGGRVPDKDVTAVLTELAEDFDGKADFPGSGEAVVAFPIRHRFFSGSLEVRIRWEQNGEETTFRAEVNPAHAGPSHAGKSLLILGSLASLPPLLCWYFPALMPLVPLSLILLFLTWLGVARKPAYFSPEFYLRRLQTQLRAEGDAGASS